MIENSFNVTHTYLDSKRTFLNLQQKVKTAVGKRLLPALNLLKYQIYIYICITKMLYILQYI